MLNPLCRGLYLTTLLSTGAVFGHFQHLVAPPFNLHHCLAMHVKARGRKYPGTIIERNHIPDEYVDWSVPYRKYCPIGYTDRLVLKGPVWSDPDISEVQPRVPLKFNALDQVYNVDRTSFTGIYEVVDGLPRNPSGRTGMWARGLLGRWGPNHAADPLVTRWKHDEQGNRSFTDGKPVLEFVAIKRKDSGEWAIPGGMVDPGDTVSNTLKKEFGEEALNSMEMSASESRRLQAKLENLFKHGTEVFRGYCDDPRNTDNAWMETVAVNYHDDDGRVFDQFNLSAGDDAGAVKWTEISRELSLYASHSAMVKRVAEMHNAYY